MKNKFFIRILFSTLAITNICFSQTIELLPPLTSAVNILSTTVDLSTNQAISLGVAGYNPSNSTPAWSIAQWGRSTLLHPGSGASSGWLNANSTAAVQYFTAANGYQNVYQLAQANDYCNNEFDLFLQPTNPINKSDVLSQLSSVF